MKRLPIALAVQIFCFFLFALCAQAQHTVFHFDPAQTQIHWKVRENLREVHGTFKLSGGMVALNSATGSAQGEILVDTDTIQSGNRSRDAQLKREILDTTKYPQAFFHATQVSNVTKSGSAEQLNLGGIFNIHGSDHPFTISVHIERTGNQAQVSTRFKVPYVDWGMKRPGGFLWRFSKEMEIEITSRATVAEVQ